MTSVKVFNGWHQKKLIKVGPNDKRKVRRSRLLEKRKEEIESESVGLSDYRKMRFARSLYRTQSFCNSWTVWRTGSSLILEPKLFIKGEWKNVTRIGRRTGSSLILEPKWFTVSQNGDVIPVIQSNPQILEIPPSAAKRNKERSEI